MPILGSTYVVGIASDGAGVIGAVSAPEGGLGRALAISPKGPVALGISGSVLLPSPSAPASLVGIANAAGRSASGSVAPNELVSFYGVGLGPAIPLFGQVVNGILTESLGGVQVLFDGVPAPLLYVGATQINAVVPSGVGQSTSTSVKVITPAGPLPAISVSVVAAQPEVAVYPPPGYAAAALNQDGTPNSAMNPAPAGSVVSIWATGGGATINPNPDGCVTGSSIYPLQLAVVVANLAPGCRCQRSYIRKMHLEW